MIIDELILHDFAQYGGRVSVELTPPSPEQPIILFGGLNGAGKTTLLDAIQLCLFGQRARSSSRDGLSYEQYLSGCIHRGNGATSASVELRFRHMAHGEEQVYHVKRSWRKTEKSCKEQLDVIRNHRADPMATDHWAEQVEEFLPSRIAHLFLFDGEQIEAYADPRGAAGLIETAVYNLLGLDLVEKLGADLSVIERRRKIEALPPEEQKSLQALESQEGQLQEKLDDHLLKVAKREAELSRAAELRRRLDERYRSEGGHLYERRVQLERDVLEAESRLRSAERLLRETAAGAAPFLLVSQLFHRTFLQVREEASALAAISTDRLLANRDADILQTLTAHRPSADLLVALKEFLENDRAQRKTNLRSTRLGVTELGRDRMHELAEGELSHIISMLPSLIDGYEVARTEVENARNQLAAMPTAEALAQLLAERDELVRREATLQAEQRNDVEIRDRLRRDLDRARIDILRATSQDQDAKMAEDDRLRTLLHIGRVRQTLDKFKEAVIRRHLARIEALVLDSFKQLVRKKTLVVDLAIDPESFQLALTARDGKPLLPDRLSAGERQLLATSVLWGLARASGRPLPTVIDTPLGRLDSSHRRRLIAHYFPLASHQVILLSTDEEIAGGYYEALKPYIGRTYHLDFDEAQATTSIKPGYFSELAHAD